MPSTEPARDVGVWPDRFFEPPAGETAVVLCEATRELDSAVAGARRNRGAPLL